MFLQNVLPANGRIPYHSVKEISSVIMRSTLWLIISTRIMQQTQRITSETCVNWTNYRPPFIFRFALLWSVSVSSPNRTILKPLVNSQQATFTVRIVILQNENGHRLQFKSKLHKLHNDATTDDIGRISAHTTPFSAAF
jgi:hypothetical protein